MAKMEELFSCAVTIKKHTERALLVTVDDEDIWLPKSQLHDVADLPERGDAIVSMSAWIAKEKGLR